MSSSDSKIKELSALAERLRNRTLVRVDPPPDTVIEELRKENTALKRKYQKALQLLALYKQRLEVDIVGSTSDLIGKTYGRPTIPRDPLLDIHFSTDDEEDLKENKFSMSSPNLLQRYISMRNSRNESDGIPETRESLDLAESLNRDNGLARQHQKQPSIPPPPLPIEERIRNRN
jgi:hypothetical protein